MAAMPWSDAIVRTTFLDSFFLAVTYLGSSYGLVTLLGLYAWWVSPRQARRLGLVLGVSFLVNTWLKELLELPRPYELDPELATEQAVETGRRGGFPSGHTQNTTAFWFGLAFRREHGPLYAAAIAMVALVAVSRVYLGVHFPLDVLGGLAIGLVLAWLGARSPQLPRPVGWWVPVAVVAAGALAWWAGDIYTRALGFLVGCLVARTDRAPSPRRGRRALVAAGGAALLIISYVLLDAGIDLLWAGVPLLETLDPESAAGTFLLFLSLTWVGLDLWPRWALEELS